MVLATTLPCQAGEQQPVVMQPVACTAPNYFLIDAVFLFLHFTSRCSQDIKHTAYAVCIAATAACVVSCCSAPSPWGEQFSTHRSWVQNISACLLHVLQPHLLLFQLIHLLQQLCVIQCPEVCCFGRPHICNYSAATRCRPTGCGCLEWSPGAEHCVDVCCGDGSSSSVTGWQQSRTQSRARD